MVRCPEVVNERNKNESFHLASFNVLIRDCFNGNMLSIRDCLSENIIGSLQGSLMIYLTSIIVIFIFIYLITTLVRPEWF